MAVRDITPPDIIQNIDGGLVSLWRLIDLGIEAKADFLRVGIGYDLYERFLFEQSQLGIHVDRSNSCFDYIHYRNPRPLILYVRGVPGSKVQVLSYDEEPQGNLPLVVLEGCD